LSPEQREQDEEAIDSGRDEAIRNPEGTREWGIGYGLTTMLEKRTTHVLDQTNLVRTYVKHCRRAGGG
jgi:hypothetical protein